MSREKKPILVRVSYYRVAPKACSTSHSLTAISACSRERSASGIGVRVTLRALFGEEVNAVNPWSCVHMRNNGFNLNFYCSACWRLLVEAAAIRHEIVSDVAEKFCVNDHGNNKYATPRRPVHLRVRRGSITKAHLQLTKQVMKATSERFRRRGYRVHVMTDEGGWSK